MSRAELGQFSFVFVHKSCHKSCTSPVQVLYKSWQVLVRSLECCPCLASPVQVLCKSCTSPGKSCAGQCQDSACAWPAQCLCKSCAGRLHRQGLRDLPCLLPTLPSHKSWSLQVLAEDGLCAVLCIRHSGSSCLYLEIQPKCLPRMLCVLCLCFHQTGEGINFASPCKCLLRMLSVLSCVSGIRAPSACTLKCNPNAGRGCSVCYACASTRQ